MRRYRPLATVLLAAALAGCAAGPAKVGVEGSGKDVIGPEGPPTGASVAAGASVPAGASTSGRASVPAGASIQAGAPAPSVAPAGQPPAECLQVLDRLSQGIPRDETGPVLRSKGLRIATPVQVPDGILTETGVVSGARIRMMIDRQGGVVPGSVTVQQSVGDPKLPLALTDAVPASLHFDVGSAFSLPPQFAFTTVYVVCARS